MGKILKMEVGISPRLETRGPVLLCPLREVLYAPWASNPGLYIEGGGQNNMSMTLCSSVVCSVQKRGYSYIGR